MRFVISPRAWHYRLYCFYENPWPFCKFDPLPPHKEPTNLCGYFWGLVLHTLFYPLFIVAVLPIALIVGAVWLAYRVWRLFGGREWTCEEKLEPPPRQPGLFRSFLSAKKAKVCPLIVIEREE